MRRPDANGPMWRAVGFNATVDMPPTSCGGQRAGLASASVAGSKHIPDAKDDQL